MITEVMTIEFDIKYSFCTLSLVSDTRVDMGRVASREVQDKSCTGKVMLRYRILISG